MQLMSQNLKLRRQGRGFYDSAAVSRLDEIIGGSDYPEEALIKRCSLFATSEIWNTEGEVVPTPGSSAVNSARNLGVGSTIMDARYRQLKHLAIDITAKLRQAIWLRSQMTEPPPQPHFENLLKRVEKDGFGDPAVKQQLNGLIGRAKSRANGGDGSSYYVTAAQVSSPGLSIV